jgi:hypothetical protein
MASVTAKVYRHPDYEDPVATLTGLESYEWQDRVGEQGYGSVAIPNLHADAATILVDDFVTFELVGVSATEPAFSWVVNARTNEKDPKDDGQAPQTSFKGPGHIGLLNEMCVLPSRGPGALPIEIDRLFSWPSPQYDDTDWDTAAVMESVAAAQGGAWPYQPFGDGFPPDAGADMIWATGSTSSLADEGDCYARKTFTLDDPGYVIIYMLIDNEGDVYFDGQKIAQVQGFLSVTTSDLIEVSDGEHTIAVRGHNAPDDGDPGGNPGGIGIAVYSANAAGVPSAPVLVTDATWKFLAYPATPPGMTPGEVLQIIFDEAQDLGFLEGWTLSCDGDEDTAGEPWPIVGDIATKVGTDYATFVLDELASTYIDVRAQPGALVLDAYIDNTFGEDSDADLHKATSSTDPATGNVTELTYEEVPTTASDLLVRWQRGWRLVSREGDGRKKMALIGLGALPSVQEVDRVAGGQLNRHADPRAAITAGFHPTVDADTPYLAFVPGDTITVPAEDGTPTVERVMGITVTPNESGEAVFALELKDVLREKWEREQTMLKKMSDGTVGGDSRPAQPAWTVGFGGTGSAPNCCPPAPIVSEGWTLSLGQNDGVAVDSELYAVPVDATLTSLTVTGECGNYTSITLQVNKDGTPEGDPIDIPVDGEEFSITVTPGIAFTSGDEISYTLIPIVDWDANTVSDVNFEIAGHVPDTLVPGGSAAHMDVSWQYAGSPVGTPFSDTYPDPGVQNPFTAAPTAPTLKINETALVATLTGGVGVVPSDWGLDDVTAEGTLDGPLLIDVLVWDEWREVGPTSFSETVPGIGVVTDDDQALNIEMQLRLRPSMTSYLITTVVATFSGDSTDDTLNWQFPG